MSRPDTSNKPRVLCVDDDPKVLDGLKLCLRREFSVLTAPHAAGALALLEADEGVTVVVSDLRMPEMDGTALLSRVKKRWPDITRILLTGEGGRGPAVDAVNEGQIFRFLTKPCSSPDLIAAVRAGLRQYRLVTAEKLLLQQTLLGSIQALVDILEIVNPPAFGRASRIKRLSRDLYRQLGNEVSWELEAAALLSQIGYVALPSELVQKIYEGKPLDAAERRLTGAVVPRTAVQVLSHIPRLERVMAILDLAAAFGSRAAQAHDDVSQCAAVLAAVLEVDALILSGKTVTFALASLQRRADAYGADLVQAFSVIVGEPTVHARIGEIPLRDVKIGMILLSDVRTEQGTLLVGRDYEVSESFLQRLKHFNAGILGTPVRVSFSDANATTRTSLRGLL